MFKFFKKNREVEDTVEINKIEEVEKIDASVDATMNYCIKKNHTIPNFLYDNLFYSHISYSATIKMMNDEFNVFGNFSVITPYKMNVSYRNGKEQEKLAYLHLLWLISTDEGNKELLENLKIRIYSDIINYYKDKNLDEIIKMVEDAKPLSTTFKIDIPKNRISHSS